MSHIEPRNDTRHRCSGEIESQLERRLTDAVSANHETTILGVGGHNEMQRNWHGILQRRLGVIEARAHSLSAGKLDALRGRLLEA